jgi:hypothetical protein
MLPSGRICNIVVKEKGAFMKLSVVSLVLLLSVLPISAQSNQLLDQLLDQSEAHFGDVVYMTLAAAKLLPDTAAPEEALMVLQQQNWNITILPPEAPVTLGTYSYMLMKAFKLNGGILYSVFPGPRYACRELGYLKVIASDARPSRFLSGEEAVRMLGKVMERQGGGS